ncbi:MAG TPA: DUF4178 domain-containing protein [Ramlibacter sp.]|nr:DUF4178 domain-containing protein [Ramlibacter sp.]
MSPDAPQRHYRAPCPGCGAPVEFRSAQSTHAVCSYCRSTVVRDGDTLRRLGRMAEVFDDHSPLQLMAQGRWQDQGFTLVGRVQYRGASGAWNEWHALFDDGALGWLSEDNGAYVMSLPARLQRAVPPASALRLGHTTAVDGLQLQVTSNDKAAVVAVEGELPRLPALDAPFDMVEMRSADGEVLSIDYGNDPPELTRGRSVELPALQLRGLRQESVREGQGRQFACPHCGAPVETQLETSKSVTCRACNSLIDLTQGIGGELRHAVQDEPVRPLIALGTVGQLQGAAWQVVGFQHRMGWDPADNDERFGWSEYLLYNRERGFMFLADSQEGWSVVKPTTGAPRFVTGGQSATYLGMRYALREAYHAETDYVAGEFYWPVERGQKSFNRDFANGRNLLCMEESRQEIAWSAGHTISSEAVASAFGLQQSKELFTRQDVAATSGSGLTRDFFVAVLVTLVIVYLAFRYLSTPDEGSSSVSSAGRGGSWGGYSSGGGHK